MIDLTQTSFNPAVQSETPTPSENYFFEQSGARLEIILKCPPNNPFLLLGPTPDPYFKLYIRGSLDEILSELERKLHESGVNDGQYDPVIYMHGAEGSNWFSKLGAGALNPDGTASGGSIETIDKIKQHVQRMITAADFDGALSKPARPEQNIRAVRS